MNAARLAFVFALAGCRLEFDDLRPPDAPGALGEITLIVTSDQYGGDPAGLPIRGATVLIDRGGGALDRTTTDDTGAARFAGDGAVACHVAYKSELGWRIYTVAPIYTATIELGGRRATDLARKLTLSVPDNTATSYAVRIPEHCATPPQSATATLSFDYSSKCDDRQVRAIVFSTRTAGPARGQYLDPGLVSLTTGSTQPVTGTYLPLPAYTIAITGMSATTTSVFARLVERADLDLIDMAPGITSATVQGGGSASLAIGAAPTGNTLRVQISNDLALPYLMSSEWIAPITPDTTIDVDARALLPLFDSFDAGHPPGLGWTSTGAPGTILAFEAYAGTVQWDAYLDPAATSVAFPALPAELGVPVPTAFDFVSMARIDVPGAVTADLARTIDRRWMQWPHDKQLFPAKGGAESRVVFSIGLGQP